MSLMKFKSVDLARTVPVPCDERWTGRSSILQLMPSESPYFQISTHCADCYYASKAGLQLYGRTIEDILLVNNDAALAAGLSLCALPVSHSPYFHE